MFPRQRCRQKAERKLTATLPVISFWTMEKAELPKRSVRERREGGREDALDRNTRRANEEEGGEE